ncbi:MAG: hypothetical protein CL609_12380 [Anaerolineaceae bacterium]|nr:hypothetical protein [Anaerolineaceae bacterium]
MKKEYIYHIIPALEWEAIRDNDTYEPETLESESLIHFSFESQVCETAARFYTGRTDLLALKVDPDLLDGELRIDPVPGDGNFPHLYSPLNLNAVVGVLKLKLNSDLSFTLVDGA